MEPTSQGRQIQGVSPEKVYTFLHSSDQGLTDAEVAERLTEVGPNTVQEKQRLLWLRNLGRQFTNFFTILLEISAAICFVADHIQPGEGMAFLGWALLSVSVLNALFSFVQEYRAERAMDALRRFLPQEVRALRAGAEVTVLAEALVPGDVVMLGEGDKVPADARLVETRDLVVNNAPLTGESRALRLTAEAQDSRLSESSNVLFAGCTISKGQGKAVVFATGGRTEFGRIATLSSEVKRNPSPLQRETAHMIRVLTVIAVSMGIVFFTYGVLSGQSLWINLVFMMGIIVANVPEGLLPTFTLSLAMGSLRMARRNVLVKGLNAVEALGAVHVIATDKTGTLTRNRLAITSLRDPLEGRELDGARRVAFLRQALVASDIHRTESGPGGDPLDVAVAEAMLAESDDDASTMPETVLRFPFDDKKRRAGGIERQEGNGAYHYCVKGAWESLRPLLSHAEANDGTILPLSPGRLEAAERVLQQMAASGQRVLALAYRSIAQLPEGEDAQAELEHTLTLKGFLGSEDPLRENIPEAVAQCHSAGIAVIMITGDHPATAEAIARQAGIIEPGSPPGAAVLTGEELARIGRLALVERLKSDIRVFARTTPEQKWKVVSAFHEMEKVVAMTGDGVNDAPALKAADVGIAMGRGGTDVAREAAQVILLDDNFASIVNGIEEGRTIFNNIRKFTNYVLVSNGPEILPYILYILFPVPLALTVLQILVIDLCTDIIPSMGLGQEKPDADVMQQPPRDKRQTLLSLPLIAHSYLFLGLIEAAVALSLFFWVLVDGGWHYGAELPAGDPLYLSATGITLSSIVLMQIGNLFGRRSRTGSGLSLDFLANPLIVIGLLFEALLSWAMLYFPPLAKLLGTGPVDARVYAVAWLGPLLIFALDYLRKRLLAMLRTRGIVIPGD